MTSKVRRDLSRRPRCGNRYTASGNSRNGHTEKTVLLENQSAAIELPRDRNGTFEPVIVPKHEKRRTIVPKVRGSMPLFNDQIISMYSFGMSGNNIQKHLEKFTMWTYRLIL
jgi:transposase-like protein